MEYINKEAAKIIAILEENGYEAYIVVGAVRDSLLDIEPGDYDITTNATLPQIKKIFKDYKLKEYKSKGLTIGIVFNSFYVEVSTFKGFTILEDLSLRDFTINAIAYNEKTGYIDPFNGILDIKRKIIRAVNEDICIINDPIRILRAIRFSATKDFKIDPKLKASMIENKDLLLNSKYERFHHEINPILLHDKPSTYIREYKEIFFKIFDGLELCDGFDQHNPYHHLDVFEHTLLVLDCTKPVLSLRLAALLHDIGKPKTFTIDYKGIGHFFLHPKQSMEMAKNILEKLMYKHDMIKIICNVIYYHDYNLINKEDSLLKFLYKFGLNNLDIYFGLRRADVLGQNPKYMDRIYILDEIAENIRRIINENKIITLANLAVQGDDLIAIGYEGHKISLCLEYLLDSVKNKRIKNNKDKLIDLAIRIRNEIE